MISNNLLRHQEASINAVRKHPEIPFVFLIGGFGCGKSFTDVQLCLFLYHAYKHSKEPITIGILGVTIKLLKQTVIADLERAFDAGNISYKDNSQAGTITVGQITFVYLAMQNPDDIYAFNFHCAICDEIDEVPAERVQKIVTAIQERCRVVMPAGKHMPSRDPFIFFSTTAQGLGGTYQLIEYLKEKELPYIKIRGRTQDNTNLAKSQIALLRGLYTEEEARAYLDGEFVNLSTGRVYPDFNPKVHLYMPFNIKEEDIIYVGQDFNAGYNAAIMLVSRNGRIFAVGEDHWNYVGDAFRMLREKYPLNRIIMIPDANGKEIMSGFMEEAEKYDIEVFWNNINPSITERITGVNKGFQFDKLRVFTSCKNLTMCLNVRDFDDSGKPRKGKGPKALDHWGDAFEYAYWHVIYNINGFEKIISAIEAVHHIKAEVRKLNDSE